MTGRILTRAKQVALAVLSLILLLVDLLRLTWLFLHMTLRVAGRTYTWFLSGLSPIHRPRMEIFLCRPSPSPFVWDDKVGFCANRSLTLWLLSRYAGCKVPPLAHLTMEKRIPNMLTLGGRQVLRLGLSLLLSWSLAAGGVAALFRIVHAGQEGRDLALDYQRKADDLLAGGQLRQARIQYLNSLQQRPDHEASLWGLAQCALNLNQAAEARHSLERLLKLDPGHVIGRSALIDFLRRQGRTAEALRLAQEGGRLHPGEPGFLVRIGECQRQLGRPTSALQNARAALAHSPDHGRALLLGAAAAADLNNREVARDYLDRMAVSVPPDHWDRLAMAQILIQCGRVEEAQKHLETLLARESSHVPAARELAELKLATGDPAGAIALYQSLAPGESGGSAIRVRLAELLLAEGRLDEAHEIGKALVRDAPQSAGGPLVLGTVYYLRELWSACTEQCQAALKRVPDSIAGRMLLSRVLMRQGRHREAVDWLKGLVEGDWLNLDSLLMLAECHVELKQWPEAQARLDRAIALFPSSEAPHLLTARLQLAAKRPDQAMASYRKALELNPRHALALNNLASLLVSAADRTEADLAEARSMASTAWELHPGNPEIADTLGWIEVLLGEHGSAQSVLSYAVRERPADGGMRVHLAMALAGLGKEEEALAQLDLARKRAPGLIHDRQYQTLRRSLRRRVPEGLSP